MSLGVWFVGGVLLGWGLYELNWWLVRREFRDLFAPVTYMDKTPPNTTELTAGVRKEQFGELANDLDYYARKTYGGTYADGLADAASKIRQVIDGSYLRDDHEVSR